jgi:HK97 gp10 family phage protein
MMADSKITLDTKGIRDLLRSEPEKVETWLDGEAEHLVSTIKLSFGVSPAGRKYTRGGVTHVASQPGNPPNVDIGTLRASIRWERKGKATRHIMDGVEYGIYLEEGTSTIRPRPFVDPAFQQLSETIGESARNNLGLEDK